MTDFLPLSVLLEKSWLQIILCKQPKTWLPRCLVICRQQTVSDKSETTFYILDVFVTRKLAFLISISCFSTMFSVYNLVVMEIALTYHTLSIDHDKTDFLPLSFLLHKSWAQMLNLRTTEDVNAAVFHLPEWIKFAIQWSSQFRSFLPKSPSTKFAPKNHLYLHSSQNHEWEHTKRRPYKAAIRSQMTLALPT